MKKIDIKALKTIGRMLLIALLVITPTVLVGYACGDRYFAKKSDAVAMIYTTIPNSDRVECIADHQYLLRSYKRKYNKNNITETV